MNLTKRTASIIIALALVFTTLVFVSVGAAGVLPVHQTIVAYNGGALENAKGVAPTYISNGKIGYFSVENAGYNEKLKTVISSVSKSNATNLYNFVNDAYGKSATINIDFYAEFDSNLDSDRVAAALDFGPGWITTLSKNTNVSNPTTDHVVDFVNGEKVTLQLAASDIIRGNEKYLTADELSSLSVQITPQDKEQISGSFYYTAPYIEGSQQLSTVQVTKVPVTTTPEDTTNEGKVAIYDSPCKITGYNSSAYSNSKFLMGDEGGTNEGRFAYIMNSNNTTGNQQVQLQMNFSGFNTLVQQAKDTNKSICMDVYSNAFDYKEHKENGTSAGEKSFCYLVYALKGGIGIDEMGAKDITFNRNIKKTLVFTPNMTGDNPEYMIFQFQNYDWSGCTLSNFEFIVSAPYLEGSTPVNANYTPSTTTTTTTYAPSSGTYDDGDITVYNNGVTYVSGEGWNKTNSVVLGDAVGAEKKYIHIDTIGTPQQAQGRVNLSGLKALRQKAVEENKSIFIDIYSNAFSNGNVNPGYCDFKMNAGKGYYPPDSNKFAIPSKVKKTFVLPLENISETSESFDFTFMNYSYGDYKSIKNAKFILSVPYILGDEEAASTVKPSTTTTTTTTTTTAGVNYSDGLTLPITAPNSEASYTGGWGNPSNQVRVANNKMVYITSPSFNGRIQMYNDTSNFGKVILDAIAKNKKIAIDFYGEFIQQGKAQEESQARVKLTFGSNIWFGSKEAEEVNGNDESNSASFIKLTSGQVTTQYYDPQAILDIFRSKTTTTKAASANVYEVEKLTTAGSAAHTDFTQTDIEPKNAKMHKFDGTTVGQYVEYTIPNQKAGTYKLSISSRDYNDRGVYEVYANGTKISSSLSFKSSGTSYVTHELGQYELAEDGNIVIKLVCKQAASGTSSMIIDNITCENASTASSSSSSASTLSDEDIANTIKIVWPHILGATQNGTTRGRYYMSVPYVEGDNDNGNAVTGPTTTTTVPLDTQPTRDGGTMPSSGWDMSKVDLNYVDCRIPSTQWVSNESKGSVSRDASGKFITLKADGSVVTKQAGVKYNINGGSLLKPFKEYLEYARTACKDKGLLAFDIYPQFSVSDGNNYAYLRATIGESFVWPKDEKAFRIQSGKRYTFYFDPDDIPDDTSSIYLSIMNYTYGDGIRDYTFHITAPYIVGAPDDATTTSSTTTTTTKKVTLTNPYPSNNAAGNTKFFVSNTKVKAGGTVKVPVMVYNNAGLFSAKFSIKYKSNELTLSGVENGDVFDTVDFNDTIANDVIEITAQQRQQDTKANGVICYLVFDTETDDMNSEIVFAGTGYYPSNFFNYNATNVPCSFKSGHVIVGNGGPADEIVPDPGLDYPSINEGSTRFTIETVKDEYNVNNKSKEQLVNVSVAGNAGLSTVRFGIKYDPTMLECTGYTLNNNVFDKDKYNVSVKYDETNPGVYSIIIEPKTSAGGAVDTTANGKFIQFKFRVVSNNYKAGTYAVNFGGYDYDETNFKNSEDVNVPCAFVSGGINLIDFSNNTTNKPSDNNPTPSNAVVGNTSLTSVRLTGKKVVAINWNAAANATGYELYRAVGNSTQFNLVYNGNSTSYTDKRVAAGKKYTYKVRAYNATSSSGLSNTLSVTTLNYKTKAVVKSLKSTKSKTLKVTLKKKIVGATGYQIQYSTSSKFKGAKSTTITSNAKTIKKLSSGKKYFVRVRSYNIVNGKKAFGKWSKTANKVVK